MFRSVPGCGNGKRPSVTSSVAVPDADGVDREYALTEEKDVSILAGIGRGAHVGDRRLDMGNPGLVRCRRYSLAEPPQTTTEVL
jgi:hypothetical protein